jgi:hypothetical protein
MRALRMFSGMAYEAAIHLIAGGEFSDFRRPESTSSLVTANPVKPLRRTASLATTASNQPQRRRRPVVAPYSCPFCCRASPMASPFGQFGGERALAHAGGVGLEDADDLADMARPKSGTDTGVAGNGVGRGDEGIGAMIDVKLGALGTLRKECACRSCAPGPG